MNKIQVGQKVYALRTGYSAIESRFNEATVTKVGRKFFEIDSPMFHKPRFFIDTLKHDGGGYMSMGRVYLNEQDYHEERRISKITSEVDGQFVGCSPNRVKLTTEQYEAIHKIIFQ